MADVFAASTNNVTLYDESAQRVGTPSNPIAVSDANGSLTVDGSVTVSQGNATQLNATVHQGNAGSSNWFVSAVQNGTWNVNAAVTGAVTVQNALVVQQYDKIQLTYTGSNVTKVEYLQGTTVVTTLFLTYTNGNLTAVERA